MAKQKVGKLLAMKSKGGEKTVEMPVDYSAVGEAWAVRGGRKTSLVEPTSAKEGYVRIALEDGDRITTGRGCVIGIQSGIAGAVEDEKERIVLTVFPDSEARITVRKTTTNESGYPLLQNRLSSIELARGLFCVLVMTEGKIEDRLVILPSYPQLEFKPMFGEFRGQKTVNGYIELGGNGTLTLFDSMNRVVHRQLGLEAGGAVDGGVKITATRDAIYSASLTRHPDARVAAVRKYQVGVGGAALLASAKVKRTKEKWTAPVIVQKQSKESRVAEAREQLKAAEESEDKALIEVAKQQVKAAESEVEEEPSDASSAGAAGEIGGKTVLEVATQQAKAAEAEVLKQMAKANASSAEMDEVRKTMEARMNGMNAYAQNARVLLASSLPSYSSPTEEEKLVRKDIKRSAKSYDMLIGDLATREADLKEKYMKGKPSAAQALAYETEMMKARQQLQEGVKAVAQNKGLVAKTASAEIGESLSYRNLDYEILRAEKGTEYGFAKSPQGKEFLLVHMRVSNSTKSDAYLDPDNAFSIIADGAQVASQNYEIKTDIASGGKREGFVIFLVPQDSKSFTFQLGMKSEKKVAVSFKL